MATATQYRPLWTVLGGCRRETEIRYARMDLSFKSIWLRNNLFLQVQKLPVPPHDGNNGGAPGWPSGDLPRDEPATGPRERVKDTVEG